MLNERNYVEKIKKEYSVKEVTKLDELRELDRKVKKSPLVFAYVYGSISALVFGTGMCFAMKVIGGTALWMILGIVIGLVGALLMSLTYKIYSAMINSRKKKYSKEILALSNELLNENK